MQDCRHSNSYRYGSEVEALGELTARLAAGARGRTEADLQADIRMLLLAAPLHLDDDDLEVFLEAPVGGGRRIDIEAGCMVVEVKKSLESAAALAAAVEQLASYVRYRSEERSQRYVGVLTDGRVWILHHLKPNGELSEVSRFRLHDSSGLDALSAWLETVLATAERVMPSPNEIVRRLGSESPAAQLDLADLHALYAACRSDPEVQVKRELWARLLLSALGTSFEDSDELFVTHTYLVLTAELIAHEIMGLPTDLAASDARALLEGQQFAMAGLHGVVEADFFDWPATISQGQPLIAAIARRLSRFDWNDVEHDVLKALYESVIDVETRRRLGEYYTPDWLAEKIVNEQFDAPLDLKLLDPACGSGTFLFWAIRKLLAACDSAGVPNREALQRVVRQIHGMDLHPVAVTLARVTYLLALTPGRLADRDELTVPVFLGDSVRWEQDDTVLTEHGMTVRTADPLELVRDDTLHFPEGVVEEPQRFDRLVAGLAERAADRKRGSKPPGIKGLLNRHKVAEADRAAVTLAFAKLCRLHDAGRDHVWSYYIRNLIRPLSFTRPEGQVDVLVGNPPWLPYRSMPPKLQRTYRALSAERGLWAGGKVATQQDLSDLFVVRAVEQYLRPDGQFAFVMPFAVLSRRQYAGFRSGGFTSHGAESWAIRFRAPEEFARVKPPLFPMPACVISGSPSKRAQALEEGVVRWSGRVPTHLISWGVASEHLVATKERVETARDANGSPYRELFANGSTMYPRVLVAVTPQPAGPLGVPAGRRAVTSRRSANEKPPWKEMQDLTGIVEVEYLRPMHLGATIVAFRPREPWLAVVPVLEGEPVGEDSPHIEEFPGFAEWWRRAEREWASRRTSKMTLLEQVDYQGKLRKQFPLAKHRVLYTKSGQHLAACRIEDSAAIIDHKLYWATVGSRGEARYLTAILNSDALAKAVASLQGRGQHNPRDFDMHVFALAFPLFDSGNHIHSELADLAARAETVASEVELDASWQFQKARRIIREAVREDGVASEIDLAVAELISEAPELNAEEGESPSKGPVAPDLLDALSQAQGAVRSKQGKKRPRKSSKPIKRQTPKRRTQR
jgi:hypothetical protein